MANRERDGSSSAGSDSDDRSRTDDPMRYGSDEIIRDVNSDDEELDETEDLEEEEDEGSF